MISRFPTTSARLLAATVLLCALLPLQSAHADALTAHSKAVFDSPSLPCMAEAIRLMKVQRFRVMGDQSAEGLRERLGKGATWKKGDPGFDKVSAIVSAGLDAEVVRGGPLLTFTIDDILNDVVARWNPEQQRRYTAFFARPAGKLYLSGFLDGWVCEGFLVALEKPPYLPLAGSDKVSAEALLASLTGIKQRLNKKGERLSKEEQDGFVAETAAITPIFTSALDGALHSRESPWVRRLQAVLMTRMPDIEAAAAAP